MKKIVLILTFFLTLGITFISKAQPGQQATYSADLYLEPITFRNNIRITSWNVTQFTSQCDIEEYGLVMGQNLILTSTTMFVNMGPQDFICDLHNPNCDSTTFSFMSCHGHLHIKDFQQFYLKDRCGNIVRLGKKVGFNMSSTGEFPYSRRFNYVTGRYEVRIVATSEQWAALTQYGTPDTMIAYDPYDNYANANDYQVVDVGKADTYGWSYPGQGVIINGIPDGEYIFGVVITPPFCMINEGNNIYPNVAEYPVYIQGTSVSLIPQLSYSTPQQPTLVKGEQVSAGSDVTVTWAASGEFCKFEITPVAVKGNFEEYMVNRKVVSYNNTTTFDSRMLVTDFRFRFGTDKKNPVRYRFSVVSVNGNQSSVEGRSNPAIQVD